MIVLDIPPSAGDKLWYFVDATALDDYTGDEKCVFAAVEVKDIMKTGVNNSNLAIEFLNSSATMSFFFRQNRGGAPFDKVCLPHTKYEIVCDDYDTFMSLVNAYIKKRIKQMEENIDSFKRDFEFTKSGKLGELKELINKP